MKEKTTLLFFENKLSGYLDNTSEIFGLDIAKYTNSKFEDIFSNETASHLKNLSFGTSNEKIGFLSGVILDAKVTKVKISDYSVVVMEFDAKRNLNPFGREKTDTIFESILHKYLPSIEEKINDFSTGRNKKSVIALKNEVHSLITKIISLVEDSKSNDILNAPESFSYIDLWEFLREIEKDIHSLGNISCDDIPYSSFYTYIKREHARNLILGILTHYIAREQRPYISFSKDDVNIVIRIANFPEKRGLVFDDGLNFNKEDIKATINFQSQASDCHIGFKRYVYNKDDNEFLLTFTPRIFEAIKEI